MISFKEKSTIGRGSYIEVSQTIQLGPNHSQYKRLKGVPLPIVIGRIEISSDGQFRYFEPPTNELNPILIGNNLKKLKENIINHKK